ncbi:MAG: helix-turn-helix domain-containing protein [Bacteroidales bacterium]
MLRQKKPGFYFSILIVFCLLAGIVSCISKKTDSKITGQFSAGRKKAVVLMASDPRAAIRLIDSVVKVISPEALSDSQMVAYLLLKTDALLKLELKDSAYNLLLLYNRNVQPGQKNAVKISTGLWLTQHLIDDGKYFLARKYLDETMLILGTESISYEKATALNLDGTLLTYAGDYLAAQKKLLAAIKLFEALGSTKALGAVYINIASNFQALNDSKLALLYYRKACIITREYKDSVNYLVALNNMGAYYYTTNADSAEYYFTKARNLLPLNQWTAEALSARFHLAGLYYDQKKFMQALYLYNEVLSLSRQQNIKSGIYRAMSGIGNVYEAQNRDNEALMIFKESGRLAALAGETPVHLRLLEAEQYMYEKAGRYKEAFNTQKTIRHINDSLFAMDKQIAIHDLELVYNNEKIERKNESLNSGMLLMKNQMRANYIIIVIVVLSALVLGILLFRMNKLYRQRDDAYNSLFEKYRRDIQSTGSDPTVVLVENLVSEIFPEDADPAFLQLIAYFDSEKPYLKGNLRYDNVAVYLRISQKKLSNLIQKNTGGNFNTFVNNYRIKEALRMLAKPELRQYKIEVIAKEAGFGSKTSFYAAFSQITGSSPSEYR